MKNKSLLKYYLLGALVLVVVIVAAVFLSKNSNPVEQKTQSADTVNTPADNIGATPVTNPTSPNGLVGTWVSVVKDKGMIGSGKVVINGNSYQLSLTSDVNLVISNVANNESTGTITFTHSCITTIISVPGKSDVTKPPQCLQTYSQPAEMRINGNSITYAGKSFLGADISLTGTYSNNSMSGTFVRTSPSGKINGTFNLVRTKN